MTNRDPRTAGERIQDERARRAAAWNTHAAATTAMEARAVIQAVGRSVINRQDLETRLELAAAQITALQCAAELVLALHRNQEPQVPGHPVNLDPQALAQIRRAAGETVVEALAMIHRLDDGRTLVQVTPDDGSPGFQVIEAGPELAVLEAQETATGSRPGSEWLIRSWAHGQDLRAADVEATHPNDDGTPTAYGH